MHGSMLILGHVELIFIFFVNHEEWQPRMIQEERELPLSIAGESSA